MYENLATLVVFAFIFSVVAGRIERSTITGPMVFIAFGVIAGPVGLGILNMETTNVELRVMADLTLALVLFIDAANADLSTVRSHALIPERMLLIGLPLCIILGVGVGMVVFPDVSLFELCILATMLAATDAALGKGVVTNKAVPARIREGLNMESGLNDGLCVPVLLVFLALATGSAGCDSGSRSACSEAGSPGNRYWPGRGGGVDPGGSQTDFHMQAPRLVHRCLDTDSGSHSGPGLLRNGPDSARQRLHRRVCRRFAVRSLREGTYSRAGHGWRRHRRSCLRC